ncbi:MAG TPA: hypothetical protein VEK80_14225 [Kribbellaceae bacterium]|nr:hypothetical protein [Kribbellaceae bacterium]
MSWGLAGVVAPLLGTQLMSRLGIGGLWWCAAGACVVLASTQPLLTARIDRRTAAVEPVTEP